MPTGGDPYVVLGLRRDATEAEVHAAYRAAVRRTHPDAGGRAGEFEAVQEAYEAIRSGAPPLREGAAAAAPPRRAGASASDPRDARRAMDDLIAESQRLEDEARRLAGLPPRHAEPAEGEEGEDSFGAILRDAGSQLLDAADEGTREVRRFIRKML